MKGKCNANSMKSSTTKMYIMQTVEELVILMAY